MHHKTIIILLFATVQYSYSQSGLVTTYFSTENNEVDKEESLYYRIRKEILSENDTALTFYSINDQLRSLEIVNEYGHSSGYFEYYHTNGQLKSKGTFRFSQPGGKVTSYYPDGRIQAIEQFHEDRFETTVIDYYDSLGNQLIKDKNGYCRCVFESYKWSALIEEGKYVDGKREAEWRGFKQFGKKYYQEFYKKGELISGTSYDENNNSYQYSTLSESAEPIGGMTAFYKAVSSVLRYPANARRYGIQGKVFAQFVVTEKGELASVVIIKGIGGGCNEETVRIIRSLPPWKPGKYRGQNIEQRMVLPITFKLG